MNVVTRFNSCSDSRVESIQAVAETSDYAKRVGGKWLAVYRESIDEIYLVQADHRYLGDGHIPMAIVEM